MNRAPEIPEIRDEDIYNMPSPGGINRRKIEVLTELNLKIGLYMR